MYFTLFYSYSDDNELFQELTMTLLLEYLNLTFKTRLQKGLLKP